MNKIEFLRDQIIETRNFTNRLIGELPEEKWYLIPEGTDSNFAWQIGHLIASQNFHLLIVISGRNAKIAEHVQIDRYNRLCYGMGATHRSLSTDLIPVNKLKADLEFVHQTAIDHLMTLAEEQLYDKLEPIPLNIQWPISNMKQSRGASNTRCGIVPRWRISNCDWIPTKWMK